MKRRDFLVGAAAAAGLSTFPLRWVASAEGRKQKVLYFTCSAGFEHGAVKRNGDQLSISEKTLIQMGKEHDVEVVCTKDGSVFDGDLGQYDAIAFYTSGDLTKPNKNGTPPMTPAGKKRLLRAVAAGMGFVAFHAGTDTFHTPGDRNQNQTEVDPYIAMVGGEFISHGPQQEATVTVTSPNFPGMGGAGASLTLQEEWYALKNFAKDLHVILVQETAGMKGAVYQRPPFPATWARKHGKGRVWHTSFGHRDDIWTNKTIQQMILGGFAWVMGNMDADVTTNIDEVTPKASQLAKV